MTSNCINEYITFNVGDTVIIHKPVGKTKISWIRDMDKYDGKEDVICDIRDDARLGAYCYLENNGFMYQLEWLEPVSADDLLCDDLEELL